jgi:glyoxylase-like metal-dependent hydrolase (beta-lactamase superfamily II)
MKIRQAASGCLAGMAALLMACSPEPEEQAAGTESAATPETPATAFDQAVAAVGGAAALENLQTLTLEAAGRRWELDESPTPGGADPTPEAFSWTANVDLSGENFRMRIDVERERAAGTHASSQIVVGQLGVITGQDAQFGPPNPVAMTSDRRAAIIKEQVLLNPIAYLRSGIENPDSVGERGTESLGGTPHRVLQIAGNEGEITYYVNADTGLISRAMHREIDFLRRDVDIVVDYGDWTLESGGIRFPRTVSLSLDGLQLLEATRSAVTVNGPISAALFEFPAGLSPVYDAELADFGEASHEVYQSMASIGFPRSGFSTNIAAEEIAPGVYRVAGSSHHSLVVEQEDGLVVIEAPLHDLRSEAVLAWIRANIGDQPIIRVVATHHHTDHSAGLRTYAGVGATIVAHELAEDFYADIMSRSSLLRPDALSRNPHSVSIETMPSGGSYTIADSSLPVTLYPLPNDHARDMVMVFVENAGVLFVSDIYSPNPAATAADPGARTLQAAIEAAGIEPTLIVGGHGETISGDAFRALVGA